VRYGGPGPLSSPSGRRKRKGCTLEISKRANGKWRFRIWNQALGCKIEVGTFTNKAVGRAAAAKMELELKTNGFIAERRDIAFGDLCDRYLETNSQHRASTREWYGNALKPARRYLGDKVSVRRITREDVQKYGSSLVGAGRAAKTVNGYMKALGAVMEQAIEWKYREDNPAHRVRSLPPNKRAVDAIRVVTREEHERLVQAAPQAYRVMFSIWPFIGLRRSEMQGLTWNDIDLTAMRLRVRYQLREDGTLDTKLKTAKSARVIGLTARVASELRLWKLASPPNELNLVFPTPNGLPQSASAQFYRVWKRACSAASIEGCTSHDMRHTFATWSLAAGENYKRVADEMGHEKPSMMLDTYLHLLPQDGPTGANKVERWYDIQPSGVSSANGTAPIPPLTVAAVG